MRIPDYLLICFKVCGFKKNAALVGNIFFSPETR